MFDVLRLNCSFIYNHIFLLRFTSSGGFAQNVLVGDLVWSAHRVEVSFQSVLVPEKEPSQG